MLRRERIMKRIAKEITKAIVLYLLGYVVSYPYCIIRYYCNEGGVDMDWIIWLCIVMSITGASACVIVNHKYLEYSKEMLKSRITTPFYRNMAIQIGCVLVLLALMLVKEYKQYWFNTEWLYSIYRRLGMGKEQAQLLGYHLVPMANAGYFLMVSCCWLSYNIMQGMFDKRMKNVE